MKNNNRFIACAFLVLVFLLIASKLGYLNFDNYSVKHILILAIIIFVVPLAVIFKELPSKIAEVVFEKNNKKDGMASWIKKMVLYIFFTSLFSMIMLVNVLTKTKIANVLDNPKFVEGNYFFISKIFIRGSIGLVLVTSVSVYLYYSFKKKDFRPKESHTKKIAFGIIIILCFVYNTGYYFGWF